ncbi:MAG: fibronectin-binding protein [Mycobacterium sp.]|uniref:fibronectin-binding protein n=1 Tax=Mycobacterium sp. TaxID=1785 RepID=UPI00389B306E
MLKRMVFAAAATVATGVLIANPASAEPGDNPCELAISFACRFVPVAPDLDRDIDLTQQQPVDPNAPPPESLPVVDPCTAGCI